MKYIVWVKYNGSWVEQGDGPCSQKTAERIAQELRAECGVDAKALPIGMVP